MGAIFFGRKDLMSKSSHPPRVAVIGAGMAGAACTARLKQAGAQVTLFDKSRGVGGRMSTRRTRWTDALSAEQQAEIDHGAQHFTAEQPLFQTVMAQAKTAGCATRWAPRLQGASVESAQEQWLAVPSMPALCRHLLADTPVHLEHTVQRLLRRTDGWHLAIAEGGIAGPFDHIVLAMPSIQAAALLTEHCSDWAETLAAVRMQPCWTLMAVTQDVDVNWDAAEPVDSPLAWVARNDRKPGRTAPAGCATWVAQASAAWSAAHLEDGTEPVAHALRHALQALLPAHPLQWQHSVVHRWRYAMPVAASLEGSVFRWDALLGLGVCGDFLGAGDVESAWHSGDALATAITAAST